MSFLELEACHKSIPQVELTMRTEPYSECALHKGEGLSADIVGAFTE